MKGIASVYVDGKFVASGSSEHKEVARVNAAEIALCKLSKLMRMDDVSIEVIAGTDGSFHIEEAKNKLYQLCGKKKWPKPVYKYDSLLNLMDLILLYAFYFVLFFIATALDFVGC